MEAGCHLKALLQLQLASDASAVLHLPYVLESLDARDFLPSSHLTKWTTRIKSLLHSKDPGGRWAGLCIAHKTSLLSQSIMLEYAQGWIVVTMPMLSENQPLPTLKAAIRLLRNIFTTACEITEFQRQVSTPNILKFTAALTSLAKTHPETELKACCLSTLAQILPIYASAHRSSVSLLSTLALQYLNGSFPNPTNEKLLQAASGLYSVLHLTGGKLGAATLWRKSLDETLSFGWSAFLALRTTFPESSRDANRPQSRDEMDPTVQVPLNLDRLRSCTAVICDLLSAYSYRSVCVPIGTIVQFITSLLSCSSDDKNEAFMQEVTRNIEISVVPSIFSYGCKILASLAHQCQLVLSPHLTRLVSVLTFRLGHPLSVSHRLVALRSINTLLTYSLPLCSPLVPTRLAKAVLPSLMSVLLKDPANEAKGIAGSKTPKRKRKYDGDEVLKVTRKIMCKSDLEGEELLASLQVLRLLLRSSSNLLSAMQSVTTRILLSLLLTLLHTSPGALSVDPSLHAKIQANIREITVEIAAATSEMSRSLPVVIQAILLSGGIEVSQRFIDILLHPRVPPLIRSSGSIESLSVFHSEESQEDKDIRQALNLATSKPVTISLMIAQDSTSVPLPLPVVEQVVVPILSNPSNDLPVEPKITSTVLKPFNITTSEDVVSQDVSQSAPSLYNPPLTMPAGVSDEEMPTIDMASDSESDH